MATQYANGQIVTSGLVLCLNTAQPSSYPGSGTVVYDISGNNYSANLVNGPTVDYQGFNLDGVNDYAYINHGGTLSFSSGNYTICVWNRDNVNPTSNYGGIITNDNSGDSAWKIFKDVGQSYYQARSYVTTVLFSNYTVGKWQMYAYTFDTGTVLTYLDGIATGNYATGAGNPNSNNNIAFGSYRYQDAINGLYLHNQSIGPTMLYNN